MRVSWKSAPSSWSRASESESRCQMMTRMERPTATMAFLPSRGAGDAPVALAEEGVPLGGEDPGEVGVAVPGGVLARLLPGRLPNFTADGVRNGPGLCTGHAGTSATGRPVRSGTQRREHPQGGGHAPTIRCWGHTVDRAAGCGGRGADARGSGAGGRRVHPCQARPQYDLVGTRITLRLRHPLTSGQPPTGGVAGSPGGGEVRSTVGSGVAVGAVTLGEGLADSVTVVCMGVAVASDVTPGVAVEVCSWAFSRVEEVDRSLRLVPILVPGSSVPVGATPTPAAPKTLSVTSATPKAAAAVAASATRRDRGHDQSLAPNPDCLPAGAGSVGEREDAPES
jgi:hypothetical protein